MSYLVLARKWRPKQFDDVVGQGAITQTLKNSILSQRIAHAYLFSGPRGIGKTTTARILAKALNCEKGPTPQPCDQCLLCDEINRGISVDVIEIDGASNNSVDDIRELREKVHYVPAKGRYKVYIIDEVHMLTTQAFNALLKTLEEPPEHIIFILATTEAHKIPLTIVSRCQRYDFKRIPFKEIKAYLNKLLSKEVEIKGEKDEALRLIAKNADGSLRDALSLLDQMISLSNGEISSQQVLDLLSLVDHNTISALIMAIIKGNPKESMLCIERVVERGHNLKHFVEQILQYIRDLIAFKLAGDDERFLDVSFDDIKDMEEISNVASRETLLRYFDLLSKAAERMRYSSQARLVLETAIIKMSMLPQLESLKNILDRLEMIGDIGKLAQDPGTSLNVEKIEEITTFLNSSENDQTKGAELRHSNPSAHPGKIKDIPYESDNTAEDAKCYPEEIPAKDAETMHVSVEMPGDIKSREATTGQLKLESVRDSKRGIKDIHDKRTKDLSAEMVIPEEKRGFSTSEGAESGNNYRETTDKSGLDWPEVIKNVKSGSMVFGSILEHFSINYKEGSNILELALKKDNPFYLEMIEEKKNQALLHAALTKVSGKILNIEWRSATERGPEEKVVSATTVNNIKKQDKIKGHIEHPLEMLRKEPVIQMAMDIFSAEIVKTLHGKKEQEIDEQLEGSADVN